MGLKTKGLSFLSIAVLAAALSLLAACPLCAADSPEDIDRQIKQQEQADKKIQQQINSTKKKLSETKAKERHVTRQLEELGQKITVTQQRVNVVSLHIKKVKNNISSLTSEIAATEKRIKEVQGLLRSRLISIYKYGGVTEFNLLLSAQGAEEAMATTHLLSKIAAEDQKMIDELTEQKQKLAQMQENLRSQKQKLESQGQQLKSKTVELKSASDQRSALLAKVRKDKALYLAQQAEQERASRELKAKINRLIAEKKRLNEERRRKAGGGNKPQAAYYKGGRLAWPVQGGGSISSEFGTRVHPVFKTKTNHTGLDIRSPKGTPVLAADTGDVLYTGWMRGYGQVIILDHGANLTTVYAHLSKIACTEDAKVDRGSVIGYVGSTGVTTGNHLHFEVRVNGNAVNPKRYLK